MSDYGWIVVRRWINGEWKDVQENVVRVTKMMIVVTYGLKEQKFNRISGRRPGRAGKRGNEIGPHISSKEMMAWWQRLERKGVP